MASVNEHASAVDAAKALSRATQLEVGSNAVAVILHGSLVSGDFVANMSDIDLLVIVHRPLNDEQVRVRDLS